MNDAEIKESRLDREALNKRAETASLGKAEKRRFDSLGKEISRHQAEADTIQKRMFDLQEDLKNTTEAANLKPKTEGYITNEARQARTEAIGRQLNRARKDWDAVTKKRDAVREKMNKALPPEPAAAKAPAAPAAGAQAGAASGEAGDRFNQALASIKKTGRMPFAPSTFTPEQRGQLAAAAREFQGKSK